jgi:regulator of replication initiation timing
MGKIEELMEENARLRVDRAKDGNINSKKVDELMSRVGSFLEENGKLREENTKLRAEAQAGTLEAQTELMSVVGRMQAGMKTMEERLSRGEGGGGSSRSAEGMSLCLTPRLTRKRMPRQTSCPSFDELQARIGPEASIQARGSPPTYCVFIDGPDPDNFICVLSAFQLLAKPTGTKLHIVLTGRPVNLHVNLLTGELMKEKLAAGAKFTDLLRAKDGDESHAEHSQAVINDMLVRLEAFLCGVGIDRNRFVLYDGGIAPTAYVSHQMHAREFLFDRADLAKELLGGEEEDYVAGNQYKVMSAETYHKILAILDAMPHDEKVKLSARFFPPSTFRDFLCFLAPGFLPHQSHPSET